MIKMIIDIEIFDDTKILMGIEDKQPDEVTSIAMLTACVIKDEDIFCPQIFLEEPLVAYKISGSSIDISQQLCRLSRKNYNGCIGTVLSFYNLNSCVKS